MAKSGLGPWVTGKAQPSANFPSFAIGNATSKPGSLGYLSWRDNFALNTSAPLLAKVVEDSFGAGPALLGVSLCHL